MVDKTSFYKVRHTEVRRLMAAKGFRNQDIREGSELCHKTVSNLKTGKGDKRFHYHTIEVLADFLDVPFDQLVE